VTTPVTPPVTLPTPPDWYTLANSCATPRTGFDPLGWAYPDRQGTLLNELKWLYSFFDATYLWYSELPALNMTDYSNPIDYFNMLKTSAITASGQPKDRFHFTYPTDKWDVLSTTGADLGYGLTWVRTSDATTVRILTVVMSETGSPAGQAGLRRGDRLVSVDGVPLSDTSAAGTATLNAGLTPVKDGESHQFVLSRGAALLSVTLTARKVTVPPVRLAKVLNTEQGKVGYLHFNEHNVVAEGQLVSAFNAFKGAGVSDLVLDLRYNGGGLLNIASELAYMVAGPQQTDGKVFEQPIFNDKTKPQPAIMFLSSAIGYSSPAPVKAGTPLPYLGLKRVTVLTTAATCSASESVINSLRGVDVQVDLIGGQTCGKPYAFTPASNCGTTYFAIQLQGVNSKGFGDYADGFTPTCRVADDTTSELGDANEGMLAAALSYRRSGTCPATPMALRSATPVKTELLRSPVKEIAIRDR
jgi:C-terminal processing protease CtpA/Prc